MSLLLIQGYKWVKVDLVPTGAVSGAGVLASKSISVGDVVMTAPKSSCLTMRTSALFAFIHDSPTQEISKFLESGSRQVLQGIKAVKTAPDDVQLTLALMFERTLTSRSRWWPYLNTLPHAVPGVPTTWPTSEAEELLRGTELEEARAWRLQKLVGDSRRNSFIQGKLGLLVPYLQFVK